MGRLWGGCEKVVRRLWGACKEVVGRLWGGCGEDGGVVRRL